MFGTYLELTIISADAGSVYNEPQQRRALAFKYTLFIKSLQN